MDREDPGIVEREREIIYKYISVPVLTLLIFAEREYFVSIGIGSVLFFSVVSLSSLDEGHSFVSYKCWMTLRLVNI